MQVRLNVTIEEDVLVKAKHYATEKGCSISQLVEDYFENMIKTPENETVLTLIKQLPPPKMVFPEEFNFTKDIHGVNNKKYGF